MDLEVQEESKETENVCRLPSKVTKIIAPSSENPVLQEGLN